MHMLYLGIKKNIMSLIPMLLKQILRQNQHFGRLASKSLDLCRDNALGWWNAHNFNNKDGLIDTKGWESSHYQVFTRVYLSVHSHFYSILNEDQLKCNSYESFKQLSVLCYWLIRWMFSEEHLSCEIIDIYVNLFLSECNAFCKAEEQMQQKWKKTLSFH